MAKSKQSADNTPAVNEYMAKLDHPFKAEVQAVREIIKNVDPSIVEQVKWNAPSFSYKGNYVVTFNLHARDRVHLVFHNLAIAQVESELLLGDYKDRRMVYFSDMNDVVAKSPGLEKILRDLIELINPKSSPG